VSDTQSNVPAIIHYLLKPKFHCHVQTERFSEWTTQSQLIY